MVDPGFLSWLASCNKAPLRFVLGAFPWGEPGPLAKFAGPEQWQIEILLAVETGIP